MYVSIVSGLLAAYFAVDKDLRFYVDLFVIFIGVTGGIMGLLIFIFRKGND